MSSRMATQYALLTLLLCYNLLHCVSAAVAGHVHTIDNNERESDGSYRDRDADHYSAGRHNVEFDHEAILGSVKEAEEFDRLTPEESKERLSLMLPKMDLNGDKFIDREELKEWILNSFLKLSKEEAAERLTETDDNRDGVVTWAEYLHELLGSDNELDISDNDLADNGMLIWEEKQMWALADVNGDEVLDIDEFDVFTNPEDHGVMHPFLVNRTLREHDNNKDNKIDFQEFLSDKGQQHDKDWVISEKDRFDHELDLNSDGILDVKEIEKWIIPQNDEIALEEVDHLFAAADDNHDDRLSFGEILAHHYVFVGSEATSYESDHLGDHFDDEL